MSKIKQLGRKPSDAEQALRESETRRNLALEAAKMGTFLWHPQEDRGEPDARMLALFGLLDGDRLNLAEALAEMIHPNDRTFYAEEVTKAVDPRGDGKLYAEIRVIHPDSSLHWIAVTAQTLFEGEPPQPMRMYGTAADITQLKHYETNLTFLNEVSLDLVGLTSIDEMMNRLGEKIGRFFDVKHCMFAEHTDELKTAVVAYGWNAEDAPNLKGTYRMRDFLSDEMMVALLTGKPLIVSETQSDARVNAESYGDLSIRSFIIVPLVREGEWRFQISIIDDKPRDWRDDEIELIGELTTRIWMRLERARAEQALRENQMQLQSLNETLEQKVEEKTEEVRQLALDVIYATQRERQRLSRVLHDDLQQRAYAILMQLSFLRNQLPSENHSARKDVSAIEKQLAEIVEITRNLSIDLSPPILPGEGLSHAIEWLVARMREQHDLPVELQATGPFVIPNEELHVFLFNCVRELLFNVVKHAEASQAVVALVWRDNGVQIEVRDDGKGFPDHMSEEGKASKQGDLPRSLGLPTIRHQLSLFGGVMKINSKPGAGTQVILVVPGAEASQGVSSSADT